MTSRLLDEPWPLSFVTAAAPNAGTARKMKRGGVTDALIRQVLIERAEIVLRFARAQGHSAIVLGAWGCGVFQNDAAAVAHAFATLLRGPYAGAFQQVTFAILGPVTNRAPFEDAFTSGVVPTSMAASRRSCHQGERRPDSRSSQRKSWGEGERSRSTRSGRRSSQQQRPRVGRDAG